MLILESLGCSGIILVACVYLFLGRSGSVFGAVISKEWRWTGDCVPMVAESKEGGFGLFGALGRAFSFCHFSMRLCAADEGLPVFSCLGKGILAADSEA